MTYLYLGVLLFAGPHLFSTLLPSLRNRLKAAIGESAWKGAYAVATLAGVVFLILAYRGMNGSVLGETVREPWAPARHLAMLASLLMFILVASSHGKGYLKSWLRHPMSLGIALWSGAHLLANSERAVVWMFATFFVVAAADLIMSFARGKRPAHEPRVRSDIIAVVAGTVLFLAFLYGFHPYVLGLPVTG
jgi:uncharacterized membrane protein